MFFRFGAEDNSWTWPASVLFHNNLPGDVRTLEQFRLIVTSHLAEDREGSLLLEATVPPVANTRDSCTAPQAATTEPEA